jgi:hypothetical protein
MSDPNYATMLIIDTSCPVVYFEAGSINDTYVQDIAVLDP